MQTEIIVALLGMAGTFLGSAVGAVATGKLTQYRLKQLEDKVNRHNNVIERTFRLEGQMAECTHDIKELKAYHAPH